MPTKSVPPTGKIYTSTAEIWTFLGITILMGIKRLPSIKLYWSGDALVSVPTLPQ